MEHSAENLLNRIMLQMLYVSIITSALNYATSFSTMYLNNFLEKANGIIKVDTWIH